MIIKTFWGGWEGTFGWAYCRGLSRGSGDLPVDLEECVFDDFSPHEDMRQSNSVVTKCSVPV